jgi:hypothetical protein
MARELVCSVAVSQGGGAVFGVFMRGFPPGGLSRQTLKTAATKLAKGVRGLGIFQIFFIFFHMYCMRKKSVVNLHPLSK